MGEPGVDRAGQGAVGLEPIGCALRDGKRDHGIYVAVTKEDRRALFRKVSIAVVRSGNAKPREHHDGGNRLRALAQRLEGNC